MTGKTWYKAPPKNVFLSSWNFKEEAFIRYLLFSQKSTTFPFYLLSCFFPLWSKLKNNLFIGKFWALKGNQIFPQITHPHILETLLPSVICTSILGWNYFWRIIFISMHLFFTIYVYIVKLQTVSHLVVYQPSKLAIYLLKK